MAICLLHNETDSMCRCSPNYNKGKALNTLLVKNMIAIDDFREFLIENKIIEWCGYPKKSSIEFSECFVLLARELSSQNCWDNLYDLARQFLDSKQSKIKLSK